MLGQEERLCYGSKSYFTDIGFAIVEPHVAKTWPANLRTTGMGSACEFAWEDIRASQFGPHYGIGASNESRSYDSWSHDRRQPYSAVKERLNTALFAPAKCYLNIVLLDFLARCEQVLFSIFRKE